MSSKLPLKPLIGITGTNGKSSTVIMLKHILEYCGLTPATLDYWQGSQSFLRFMQDKKTINSDCVEAEIPATALTCCTASTVAAGRL